VKEGVEVVVWRKKIDNLEEIDEMHFFYNFE